MKSVLAAAACALALTTAYAVAQAPAAAPFAAGDELGVAADGKFSRPTPNVKVFGAIVSAESCMYHPERNLIISVNRGAPQNQAPNDAFVSLINHDGSVHTTRWIGVNRNGLTLNEPLGSDVALGKLYVADSDGGTADGAPRTSVLRMFDLKTGAPAGQVASPGVVFFNDIAVARDGTVYGSETGAPDNPTSWKIQKITPDGKTTLFTQGAPLGQPNGVAIDGAGNIVVVNILDAAVLTFSPAGKLLKTEQAAQPGNDGLVIMADGTKYVSSVRNGGVSRIRANAPTDLIASGIPTAASMCYDSGANQLVIPMNNNNGLAFIKLQ